MTETNAVEIAVFLVLVACWVVILRDAWRAWQPARLLLAGRHTEARIAAERLERSWMRVFPGVRRAARYAIGCALHLEGDLEGSLAVLTPLQAERLRGNLRYAICSIQAANLVLLDRDPTRASALLDEAGQIHRPPEDILLAAHAKLGLGEKTVAATLFAAAGTERTHGARLRLDHVLLLEDHRQQEAIFHTLRGLYLVKVGRETEAQGDFDIAAKSPLGNVYVERARAMRKDASVDSVDPRSSLAPQVVGDE